MIYTNENEFDRRPPSLVRRQLRQEVGFGCPIEGCRKPFLEYHHFDPTWAEEKHHRPEGMIALCTEHHPMADARTWSKAKLREMKSSAYSVEDVRAKFPWEHPNPLVRLGGIYTAGAVPIIEINGESLLGLSVGEQGLLELSFTIRDTSDLEIARMENNDFFASPSMMNDLQVNIGATSVQINSQQRGILLKMESSRIAPDELTALVDKDGWGKKSANIASYAARNCSDEEGRIALLDFRNLKLHANGREIWIRDGLATPGCNLQRAFLPGTILYCSRGDSILIGAQPYRARS